MKSSELMLENASADFRDCCFWYPAAPKLIWFCGNLRFFSKFLGKSSSNFRTLVVCIQMLLNRQAFQMDDRPDSINFVCLQFTFWPINFFVWVGSILPFCGNCSSVVLRIWQTHRWKKLGLFFLELLVVNVCLLKIYLAQLFCSCWIPRCLPVKTVLWKNQDSQLGSKRDCWRFCGFCWLQFPYIFISSSRYTEQSTEFEAYSFPKLARSRMFVWVQSLIRFVWLQLPHLTLTRHVFAMCPNFWQLQHLVTWKHSERAYFTGR